MLKYLNSFYSYILFVTNILYLYCIAYDLNIKYFAMFLVFNEIVKYLYKVIRVVIREIKKR